MVADHTGHVRVLRSGLTRVMAPFQSVVNWPMDTLYWLQTSMTSAHTLRMENAQLRSKQLLLEARLQRLAALEKENSQLKALLQSSLYVRGKTEVAHLLQVALAPFTQQVIVDKGARDDVYVGQPVLDAHGVMGQVVEVNNRTARVLLITDTQSAVPVQNARNGVRAVAKGLGYCGELSLLHVPETADFKPGDRLMTSGLGRLYPAGYPVGVIRRIETQPGLRFAKVQVQPEALLDRTTQVLLIWPDHRETEPSQPAAQSETSPAVVTTIKTFGATGS